MSAMVQQNCRIHSAFIINFVVTVVVSLFDKKKDNEMLEKFDAYKKAAD